MEKAHQNDHYKKIAETVQKELGWISDEFFMYVEAADAWLAPTIIQRVDDRKIYRDCSTELSDIIIESWEASKTTRPWRAATFVIKGLRVNVALQYPEELDLTESAFDRSERAILDHFGDDRIDYSEVPPLKGVSVKSKSDTSEDGNWFEPDRSSNMQPVEMGPMYEEIGQLVAEDIRHTPEGAFLYAEVRPYEVDCSLFKDIGDRVIYRDCSDDLTEKLYRTWQAITEEKRWSAMSYSVLDGRFSVAFEYSEDWVAGEAYPQRQPRILAAKFGNKKIDYSDP